MFAPLTWSGSFFYFEIRLTDHGGATSQRRLGSLVEVVGGDHAPVGHLEARVHIDAAGHQHAAVSVDGFHPAGNDEVLPNLSEKIRIKKKKKKQKERLLLLLQQQTLS